MLKERGFLDIELDSNKQVDKSDKKIQFGTPYKIKVETYESLHYQIQYRDQCSKTVFIH